MASVFDTIPEDLQLERAIIGGLLLWGAEKARIAAALIAADDFYCKPLSWLYRIIMRLNSRGIDPDIHAMTKALAAWNEKHRAHPLNYTLVMECREYAAEHEKPANFEPYCKALRELSRRRAIQRLLLEAGAMLTDPANYADPTLQFIRSGADVIANMGGTEGEIITAAQMAQQERDRLTELYDQAGIQAIQGEPTGVRWLDESIGGYQAGDLIIIGARPNTSKTRWTIASLAYAALAGTTVGFISLDMGKRRLARYLITQLANIAGETAHSSDVYSPYAWGDLERGRLADICDAVDRDGRFWLVAEPRGSRMANIESYVREMANKRGCKVIAIDQLQNIAGWESGGKDRSEYSRIVKGCKDLARHYNVCLLALHQIQRAGAAMPTMANLKDTGCLEEYSDVVLILHDQQRALIEACGAFVRDDSGCRAPKAGDDDADMVRNVDPVRDLRIAVEKNRNDSTRREYVTFDFPRGVMQ